MSTLTSDHTPFQYRIAGNYKHRQTVLTTPELQRDLCTEMNKRWVGPVSPDVFMNDLMPIGNGALAEYELMRKKIKFRLSHPGKESSESNQEKRLYQSFVSDVFLSCRTLF